MVNGTILVKEAPTGKAVENQVSNIAGVDQYRQVVAIGDTSGTWGYYAGTSGTVNVAAGQRVLSIAAHGSVAASLAINGGQSIPIPALSQITIEPRGNLTAPTIVFSSTDSFLVEVVS